MTPEERIIHAYAQVARPILLRYVGRRSCIASARAGLDTLAAFGVEVKPVAVNFCLSIPELNVAYIAGVEKADRMQLQKTASDWVELDSADSTWNGHVILAFGTHCLIDPSFDQAFASIAEGGIPVPVNPLTMVLPLDGRPFMPGMFARYSIRMDPPEEYVGEIRYEPKDDASYQETPAWQDEAMPFIVSHIIAAVRSILI